MANITVDITTLENYSSISLGSHQLTVVAKAPGFLDSDPSTAVTFVNGYELVFDTISNCTYTPSPSMISAFDSTTITFTPDAHYVLPDSIYVGGTADHTWDKSTGRLVLSNVKSNITLECEATLETFPVTISATGCTYSPTGWTEVAYGEGGEIWLQNVNSGYRLPDSVTVTGASYEYNKDSGFIRISNATGPVTVTITCVQIYTITANITNGSWSGNTQVDVGASATGTITPNSGYSYPTEVTATNATVSYTADTGTVSLTNITGNVVITAECLTQLTPPQNVSADGTTVSWDEVENATSYAVLADGSEIGTVEKETGYSVTINAKDYWYDATSSNALKIYDGERGSSTILLNQSPPDKTAFPMTFTVTSGKCAIEFIGGAVMGDITSSDYERYPPNESFWPEYFIIDKDGTINVYVSTWND